MIPELGIYHYKARAYSPYLGRFPQTDPIGYDDQYNLYAYVGNDPMNLVDPTGLEAKVHFSSTNKAKVTIPYTIVDASTSGTIATSRGVNAAIASSFSGTTTVNGNTVDVTAEGEFVNQSDVGSYAGDVNIVTVTDNVISICPTCNPRGGVQDGIGGEDVVMPASATNLTIAHDLGHSAGAGDQYGGGEDANNNTLTADVPGPANVMKDLTGAPANAQTLREILTAPTNTRTCAPGGSRMLKLFTLPALVFTLSACNYAREAIETPTSPPIAQCNENLGAWCIRAFAAREVSQKYREVMASYIWEITDINWQGERIRIIEPKTCRNATADRLTLQDMGSSVNENGHQIQKLTLSMNEEGSCKLTIVLQNDTKVKFGWSNLSNIVAACFAGSPCNENPLSKHILSEYNEIARKKLEF